MEEFPFTEAEWEPLKRLADSILNASFAKDDAVAASLSLDLLDHVSDLREQYGDHPVLLETAADYTDDDSEACALYRRAIEIAEAHGLPTLSIRRSFAFSLMCLGQPAAALEELHACGPEAADGEDDERADWVWNLKTAPDFAADDLEACALYRRAMEIAAAYAVPALGLRLGLVRRLLDMDQPAAAIAELRACRNEVPGADEDDRTWWAGLIEEATQANQRPDFT